ncbi:MAG: tripartite tricarboxylate transporter TctB family protein [Fretibacterium sp.]|nr:tripartite tricarboxylate transporter TctB family protein [Fretibacterium sp.]
MRNNDVISGLFATLFGAALFVATWLEPKLTFIAKTSDGVPGAGFFPYLMSGTVALLGTALTVKGLGRRDTAAAPIPRENLRLLFGTLAGLIGFLVLWPLTGHFYPLALLLCLFLNRLLKRSWLFAVVYSLGLCLLAYLVFTLGFSVQFNA